jgi:phosphopantothenoylcysteine decarboxylase
MAHESQWPMKRSEAFPHDRESPRRLPQPFPSMSALEGREILLGVTGGIAAYKAAELASRIVQGGAQLSVVLTEAATRFIGPTTFEALTGRPVYRESFQAREHYQGEHIGLARRADLFLVAPATADYLAKVAHGHADDLLSTLALTITCPALFAPAMNSEMWAKPAVQRNVAQLRDDGVHFVDPGSGWLSCGQVGPGRMAEPFEILEHAERLLSSR